MIIKRVDLYNLCVYSIDNRCVMFPLGIVTIVHNDVCNLAILEVKNDWIIVNKASKRTSTPTYCLVMTVSMLPLSKQACNMIKSRCYLHIINI